MSGLVQQLRRSLRYHKILKTVTPKIGNLTNKRRYYKERCWRIENALNNRLSSIAWYSRIRDALSSDDNKKIPRCENAGKCFGENQIMHNGLLVAQGSYYGKLPQYLILLNQGVHEPQEECIFQEVLKYIPENATMLELGAYWSFYSMWFQKNVSGAKNFMVEAEMPNLHVGRLNFELNKFQGKFINGFIADKAVSPPYTVPTMTVDSIVQKESLERIHLLHSDIQGFEYKMLLGAQKTFTERKVDFAFISTHSDQIHDQCRNFLISHKYTILAEHTLAESFSIDGLIVAKREEIHPELKPFSISKRKLN